MKKLFYNGVTIHLMVQLLVTWILWLFKRHLSVTVSSMVFIVTLLLYLIIIRVVHKKLNPKGLRRDLRLILGINVVLLGLGMILYQYTGLEFSQFMMISGIYFNYGFNTLFILNLPDIISLSLMIILSPLMIYMGYVINGVFEKKKTR